MEYRRRLMGKKREVDYSLQYFTLVALQTSTFTHSNFDVDYSVDGGHRWATLSAGSSTPTVQAGTKVMFRGNITPSTSYGVGTFTGTNNFEAEGNVMSLLYSDKFVWQKDLIGQDFAFYRLLYNASYLQSAKNLSLPATRLTNSCYDHMFTGCTSLTTAPELPATRLANSCYDSMFRGCTSLTTTPELPATRLTKNCYSHMFSGCTSLTTAPELPAQYLAYNCYYRMFYNCSRLNYIKAMFTTTPSNSYTNSWVSGVASSGTFVMNSAATWNVAGVNGVPSGWTVTRASS